MQTRVSHYLRDLERAGLIGAGTTLHGLRVSYAAWWKRTGGASNSEVADLLGDKSERMGKHYTRHVEAEANVIRAFTRSITASGFSPKRMITHPVTTSPLPLRSEMPRLSSGPACTLATSPTVTGVPPSERRTSFSMSAIPFT